MSHTYLIDLYDLIEQETVMASEELKSCDNDKAGKSFQQGRLDILSEFKRFLADHYNSKLPRRIRNKYTL
jgi:hypothetical protein